MDNTRHYDTHVITVDVDDVAKTADKIGEALDPAYTRGELVAIAPETKNGTTIRFWLFFRPR